MFERTQRLRHSGQGSFASLRRAEGDGRRTSCEENFQRTARRVLVGRGWERGQSRVRRNLRFHCSFSRRRSSVRSPIDHFPMDGIRNSRIHYAGQRSPLLRLRWTDLFFVECHFNALESFDPTRLADSLAKAFTQALTPFVDMLAEGKYRKLALRVTVDRENVSAESERERERRSSSLCCLLRLRTSLVRTGNNCRRSFWVNWTTKWFQLLWKHPTVSPEQLHPSFSNWSSICLTSGARCFFKMAFSFSLTMFVPLFMNQFELNQINAQKHLNWLFERIESNLSPLCSRWYLLSSSSTRCQWRVNLSPTGKERKKEWVKHARWIVLVASIWELHSFRSTRAALLCDAHSSRMEEFLNDSFPRRSRKKLKSRKQRNARVASHRLQIKNTHLYQNPRSSSRPWCFYLLSLLSFTLCCLAIIVR